MILHFLYTHVSFIFYIFNRKSVSRLVFSPYGQVEKLKKEKKTRQGKSYCILIIIFLVGVAFVQQVRPILISLSDGCYLSHSYCPRTPSQARPMTSKRTTPNVYTFSERIPTIILPRLFFFFIYIVCYCGPSSSFTFKFVLLSDSFNPINCDHLICKPGKNV